MMIRAILTIINIKMSQKINGFLYYLKKIPGIKKLFKNTNYSLIGFKKFLSTLSFIYSLIAGPIGFALIFFLAIYLPSYIFYKEDIVSSILFMIFIFFFVFKLLGSEIMEPSQEKFLIVKQMKMNPKVFAISQTISDRTIELFSKGLVLSLVFKLILNIRWIRGLQITVAIVMFSIFMEAFHLYIYKKTNFNMKKFIWTRFTIIVLLVIATYAAIGFTDIPSRINLFSFFTNMLVSIVLTILGLGGFIYLLKYDRYWDIINENNKLETYKEFEESIKDVHFQEVKLKEKDFDEKALRENETIEKEGYDYLNYIFFKRHKRKVYKPMLIKSAIILAGFLLLFIVDQFFIPGVEEDITKEIISTYTILIFAVYAICNSESIIKSMFYNCDRSLLRYGFYKRGDALLKMFFLRLKTILLTNMVPIGILCIGLFQMIYFNDPENIGEIAPIIASTIILSLLFSVHYIFLYYILQPFTTSLKMKSPLYSIINFAIYFTAYYLIRLNLSARAVLPYILIFSTIYIFLAIVLVYKKAPKTFRVK